MGNEPAAEVVPDATSWERSGLERGCQEGRDEGRREALRRVVQARFGVTPEALERRIAAADGEVLDDMLNRVSAIRTVDDL